MTYRIKYTDEKKERTYKLCLAYPLFYSFLSDIARREAKRTVKATWASLEKSYQGRMKSSFRYLASASRKK